MSDTTDAMNIGQLCASILKSTQALPEQVSKELVFFGSSDLYVFFRLIQVVILYVVSNQNSYLRRDSLNQTAPKRSILNPVGKMQDPRLSHPPQFRIS